MNNFLIPIDKANHFLYGFVIFILAQFIFNDFVSFIIVLLIALSKEIKDEIKYKGFDYKDLIATILPAILTILFR